MIEVIIGLACVMALIYWWHLTLDEFELLDKRLELQGRSLDLGIKILELKMKQREEK